MKNSNGPSRLPSIAIPAPRAANTDFIVCRGDENLGHGAQKPVSVYTDLLERSARAGEHVLDLCCGTGTIFPAAHALKCIATGVELISQNAAIAKKRLDDLGGSGGALGGSVAGALGL